MSDSVGVGWEAFTNTFVICLTVTEIQTYKYFGHFVINCEIYFLITEVENNCRSSARLYTGATPPPTRGC